MSSSRAALRQAFAAAAAAIPGVANALDHEPGMEALPPLPCVTMLSDLYSQEDVLTGPATENIWGWEVRVYVDLVQGYREAQEQLDDLVPAVLGIVRANTDIDGTCLWARLQDPGGTPFFAHDEQKAYAWKVLQLRAEMEET